MCRNQTRGVEYFCCCFLKLNSQILFYNIFKDLKRVLFSSFFQFCFRRRIIKNELERRERERKREKKKSIGMTQEDVMVECETSLPSSSMSSSSQIPPAHQGYLLKKTKKMGGFRNYFVVLADGNMTYFKTRLL